MFTRGVFFSAVMIAFLPALLVFPGNEARAALTNLGQETPIAIPDCIAGTTTAIAGDDSELIAAVADPGIDVICLKPGHYASVRLMYPGTEFSPKYLIPSHASGAPLADPWNLPSAERVIIDDSVEFLSEYWHVIGIAITSDRRGAVNFETGSFGNVLDRALVEGRSERLATGTGGGTMVRMGELSMYNAIQNSVVRNSPRIPGQDSHCIYLANSQFNTIIDNEIYDCAGDAIQFGWLPDSGIIWDDRGNKIVGNEIYVTPRLYADCNDPSEDANLNGTGECACAENALDIKIISASSIKGRRELVEVSHNTAYGFRQNHPACGGTGDTGGPAIFLHNEFTSNARVYNNLIFDADTGIQLQDLVGGGMTNIEVFNNVLYNIRLKGAIQLAGGVDSRIVHNTMILTLGDDNNRKSIRVLPSSIGTKILHNLTISESILYKGFMDADHPDPSGLLVALNGYVGLATPIRNTQEMLITELPQEPLSNYLDLCVTLNRYTGGVLTCIPYVVPTASAGITDRFRNRKFSYGFDYFDNQRTSPRDLGAVEH